MEVYMPSLTEFEKWLTTGQAASKLGKSRQGVTWLVENKKLRAVKTQAGWLIDPDALAVYKATDKASREG
ncbi:MAG: helix-turn-helix domain-containing protein [Rubrobacter sp.]